MGAGNRRERIHIQWKSATTDSMGGRVETWQYAGSLWAAVKPVKAGEANGKKQAALRTQSAYQFTVDTRSTESRGATPVDRIVWQGRPYNIREVRLPASRTISTEIIADLDTTDGVVTP